MDVFQMWWLSLGIFALVIVVVAILLGLIVAAAKSIDGHAAKIWTAGKQIAGNTVSIWMLEKATDQLREVVGSSESIAGSAESIDETLGLIAATAERKR